MSKLTSDRAILIGHVRHDGTGDYSNSLQDDRLDVGQGSSVLQADVVSRDTDSVDLLLGDLLDSRSRREEAEHLDQEITDRGVPSDDVLHHEQRGVPGHVRLGVRLHVIDQTVHVIVLGYQTVPAVQFVGDDVVDDELSYRVAPVSHPRHVAMMKGHQERQEVGRVSLVHLEEHTIEIGHHGAETGVLEAEVLGA